MGYQTTPNGGLHASIFRYRTGGFKGSGLNDLTWGTGYNGVATGYFEVVIDGKGTGIGGVDEFKWRKNGGAWTEHVDITGSAQTLSDTQTVTFAATTGHTAGTQWMNGNLAAEGTTESTSTAQITTANYRLCFPKKLTWTDSGGKTIIQTEYANGKGYFSGNVGTVTVAGNNSFVIPSALDQVAYCLGWNLNINVKMLDTTSCGDKWTNSIADTASFSGSIQKHLIASRTFFEDLKAGVTDTSKALFLLELYFYDSAQDQTGDKYRAWVNFDNLTATASLGAVASEAITFKGYGLPSIIAST